MSSYRERRQISLLIFIEFNPLRTSVPHHIETSQLICNANQLTGFYMMRTLVVNGLSKLTSIPLTLPENHIFSDDFRGEREDN